MTPAARLASDGVSCSMCHQIEAEGLGTPQSFVAGFTVDEASGLGADRQAFGPFEIDGGRKRVMRSSALLEPNQSKHVQDSALCGSCHTLYTHTRGREARSSAGCRSRCPTWSGAQRLHGRAVLPVLPHARPGGTSGTDLRAGQGAGRVLAPRFPGRQLPDAGHSARERRRVGRGRPGGDLRVTAERTREHLREKSARVALERTALDGRSLAVDVRVENLAGHKLPTAYPSRRAWLRLRVEDAG
ncbi:hypothetical protein, partial [Desulfohalovibrio reitneri]|uniref:hypothetical protein n=1 Tax=Desulfohalovibrio reitneri TaxID=1307759 RepID=UPI001F180573